MKSWQTTLFGAISAVGGFLSLESPEQGWASTVGKILVIIGTAGIGYFARDNNKSSESVGAKEDAKSN